ncbi:MAG: helix-turn-helix domain-containing protein [Magnetococcales bacterium]|nr:helix-turn-helix domain-containing protein [Magnetococcales bacterium]
MITLLTTVDAAKFLDVHAQTLTIWRRQNRGPKYIPIEGNIRYDQADLVAWLESRKVDPSSLGKDLPKIRPKKYADLLRETLNLPRVPRGRPRKTA